MSAVVQLRLPRLHGDLRDNLDVSGRLAGVLALHGIRALDQLLDRSWDDADNILGLSWRLAAQLDDALAEKRAWIKPRAGAPPLHAATPEERVLPLDDVGLHPATACALVASGVTTVGDLVDRTRADVHRLPGVGPASLSEVRHALTRRGLALAAYVRHRDRPEPVHGDPSATIEALAEHGYLRTRACIRLFRLGAHTVEDVAALSAEDLHAVEGLGRTTLSEVRWAVKKPWFHLRGEESRWRR